MGQKKIKIFIWVFCGNDQKEKMRQQQQQKLKKLVLNKLRIAIK